MLHVRENWQIWESCLDVIFLLCIERLIALSQDRVLEEFPGHTFQMYTTL